MGQVAEDWMRHMETDSIYEEKNVWGTRLGDSLVWLVVRSDDGCGTTCTIRQQHMFTLKNYYQDTI